MDKLKAYAKISSSPSSGSVLHVYIEVPIACVECLYLMFRHVLTYKLPDYKSVLFQLPFKGLPPATLNPSGLRLTSKPKLVG